jgi:hypothetical protein
MFPLDSPPRQCVLDTTLRHRRSFDTPKPDHHGLRFLDNSHGAAYAVVITPSCQEEEEEEFDCDMMLNINHQSQTNLDSHHPLQYMYENGFVTTSSLVTNDDESDDNHWHVPEQTNADEFEVKTSYRLSAPVLRAQINGLLPLMDNFSLGPTSIDHLIKTTNNTPAIGPSSPSTNNQNKLFKEIEDWILRDSVPTRPTPDEKQHTEILQKIFAKFLEKSQREPCDIADYKYVPDNFCLDPLHMPTLTATEFFQHLMHVTNSDDAVAFTMLIILTREHTKMILHKYNAHLFVLTAFVISDKLCSDRYLRLKDTSLVSHVSVKTLIHLELEMMKMFDYNISPTREEEIAAGFW